MRRSKLSQSILAVLTKYPNEELHIYTIAEELGKNIDRESSARASISRCLNRMQREGLVDFDYLELFPGLFKNGERSIPNKHAGKYWYIVTDDS